MAEKRAPNSGENDYIARLRAIRQKPSMRFVTMPIGHTIPGFLNHIQGDERRLGELGRGQRLALALGSWLIGFANQVPVAKSEATWCDKVAAARLREVFENDADQVIAEALNELEQERQLYGPTDPDQSKTRPKLNFAAPPPQEVAAADHAAGVVDQIAADLVAEESWLATMKLFEDEDGRE